MEEHSSPRSPHSSACPYQTSPLQTEIVNYFQILKTSSPNLTIAMSCLAAGFSTGVTSFSPLVSAPWIADSSSEVGLHSDILAVVVGREVFAGLSSDTE